MHSFRHFTFSFRPAKLLTLSFLLTTVSLAAGRAPGPTIIHLKADDATPQSLLGIPAPNIPQGAKQVGEMSCNISQNLDSYTALSLVKSNSAFMGKGSLELISRYSGVEGRHTFRVKCTQKYELFKMPLESESGVTVELRKD